ncbi:MAG: hydantoinase B/oxoprolinase family protein [Pseudomonadota bacterium]
MNTKKKTVANQVMWNRLISIVEEQAQALIRTAFSTSVREAGDLSAGVYDLQGRMLAQAVTGTPGHVNAMADAVPHFIRRIGRENIYEGDVYVTNDPWEGTGHLHDFTVVSPSFHRGELVGFFACTAHVVDVGGRGFGADANSVYEEGIYIPIMKFAERGQVDYTLTKLIKGNVREPDQVIGDLYALSTCNEIGHRRLVEMLDEFDLNNIEDVATFIIENSKQSTIDRIAALPKTEAASNMTIDGFDTPIVMAVKVSIEGDQIVADYEGSSGVDKKGINCPLVYTKAYTCYALKCTIAPDIPNNAGSLEPFKVVAPSDTIVNAPHPAPVALRHIVGHFVPDTVFGALDKIIPNTVPAEGAGCLCNFQVSLRPTADGAASGANRRAEVLTFNSGGSGARPQHDGLNATAFPSGVMTMPIEATEQVGPIVIWRKELRSDSGGAGERRGGLGQVMEISALDGYEFDLQAMFDRGEFPARGRHGGEAGAPTTITRSDAEMMNLKGKQFVPSGARVRMEFPGGGGYGDPKKRDSALLKRDLARGYITESAAMSDYGLSASQVKKLR